MATDYVDLVELKEHLGLQSSAEFDDKLGNVITSVSRWIDGHCQRHFHQVGTVPLPVARVFDANPCNPHQLRLGDTPVTVEQVSVLSDVIQVTELATDENGDGTFERVWSAGEYQLLPLNTSPAYELRAIDRRFPLPRWHGRVGLVRVTGLWGFPTVPGKVEEAGLMQCARIFKRKDAPEGVVGFDQFGIIRVSGRPDPDVAAMVNHLVHPQAAYTSVGQ